MTVQSPDFQEKDRRQKRLLLRLLHETKGRAWVEVNLRKIAKEEGLTYDDAYELYCDLLYKGWAKHITQGLSIEVTSEGIEAIRRVIEGGWANSPSSQTITQNFSGANIGAIQSGNYSTAHVTQNLNPNISEILRAIDSLQQLSQAFPEEERINASAHIDNLKREVKSPDGGSTKKKESSLRALLGIGQGVTAFAKENVPFLSQVLTIFKLLGLDIDLL